jgi:hypothetical protein
MIFHRNKLGSFLLLQLSLISFYLFRILSIYIVTNIKLIRHSYFLLLFLIYKAFGSLNSLGYYILLVLEKVVILLKFLFFIDLFIRLCFIIVLGTILFDLRQILYLSQTIFFFTFLHQKKIIFTLL